MRQRGCGAAAAAQHRRIKFTQLALGAQWRGQLYLPLSHKRLASCVDGGANHVVSRAGGRRRSLWAATAAMALAWSVAASAQVVAVPDAHLQHAEGSVARAPRGDREWHDIGPRRALQRGDRLWTDRGSRAELQAGGHALRLDERTHLTLEEVDDTATRLSLPQGSLVATVTRARPGDSFEVGTPNLALRARQAGDYRIDVDIDAGTTRVTVLSGLAVVYGEQGDALELKTGQRATFRERALAREQHQGLFAASDAFDRWAGARRRGEPTTALPAMAAASAAAQSAARPSAATRPALVLKVATPDASPSPSPAPAPPAQVTAAARDTPRPQARRAAAQPRAVAVRGVERERRQVQAQVRNAPDKRLAQRRREETKELAQRAQQRRAQAQAQADARRQAQARQQEEGRVADARQRALARLREQAGRDELAAREAQARREAMARRAQEERREELREEMARREGQARREQEVWLRQQQLQPLRPAPMGVPARRVS